MAVHHSPENLLQLTESRGICSICNSAYDETNIGITPCQHTFHRNCINTWLDDNNTCPLCRQHCDSQSLKSFAEQEFRPSLENLRNQGAIPRNVNVNARGSITRSRAANAAQQGLVFPDRQSPGNFRRRGRPRSNNVNNSTHSINSNQIQAIIEDSLRMNREHSDRQIREAVDNVVQETLGNYFRNLNIAPRNVEHNESNERNQEQRAAEGVNINNFNNRDHFDNFDLNNIDGNGNRNNQARREIVVPSLSDVSKIISNWKLTFDGSSDSIAVGEFIYRVNALTRSSLRGNFTALCQNAHVLFEGKAKSWFWRYHHSVAALDWIEICEALKRDFKDFRTDSDVKESMRNRKQRSNEPFEGYLDIIMRMSDGLRNPMTDQELVELVVRNLLPEIRLEMLHLELNSISDLRKACRRRENFFSEIQNKAQVTKSYVLPRRNISEIEGEPLANDSEVSALNNKLSIKPSPVSKCWNCDEVGHRYKDCVKPRRVFCYGCGLIAFFLPNCPNCNSPENQRRDVHNTKRHPNNSFN